jgi:hypothetical protein
MKRMLKAAVITGLVVLAGVMSAPLSADTAKTPPSNPLPYTFVCKHCMIKMTVKATEDWKKECWVCPCKVPTVECLPTAKKAKKH